MAIIYTAIAVFGIAAILGMYLLSLIVRDKQTPKAVSILHGVFAVVALSLLIFYCSGHYPSPLGSLMVFAVAALGGIILFYRDVTGKSIPKWLGFLHGSLALTGFGLLLAFAFYEKCCGL